jgi:hypothetical protein
MLRFISIAQFILTMFYVIIDMVFVARFKLSQIGVFFHYIDPICCGFCYMI